MTALIKKLVAAIAAVPRKVKLIVALVVVLLVLAVAVPVGLMNSSKFLNRYKDYADNYKSLQASVHKDVECGSCHIDERGPVVHAFALTGEFYKNLFSAEAEPTYISWEAPSREACAQCHEEDWSYESDRTAKIPHPAHLRVSTETRDCVTCHKWTGHAEDYLEQHKTMPFSGVCSSYGCHAGWKSDDECSDCHHTLRKEPKKWAQDHLEVVTVKGDGSCLESCHEIKQCRQCHTTGKSPFSGEGIRTENDRLETLHAASDWMRKHGAEGLKDQTRCLSCHISVGECQNCHLRRPASHGADDTWVGTHKNAVKSDKQCVTCHKKVWCDDCHAQFKEMR